METHFYKVRPGYGSELLLLEFQSPASEDMLRSDLLHVLKEAGAVMSDVRDLVFISIVKFDSPEGNFDYEEDEWGSFFISSEKNQRVIGYLDEAFQASHNFERQTVDLADYELSRPD